MSGVTELVYLNLSVDRGLSSPEAVFLNFAPQGKKQARANERKRDFFLILPYQSVSRKPRYSSTLHSILTSG